MAPRLHWSDFIPRAAYLSLCSINSKEDFVVCLFRALTPDVCHPQDEEQLLWGWNGMAWVKISCIFACEVQWLYADRMWMQLDLLGIY